MMDSEGPGATGVFASKLRKLLPGCCSDRPFECDGLPQGCEVMLIGENPATDISGDFNWWCHWSDTDGFNQRAMADVYDKARARLSGTRDRIGILKDGLRAGSARLLVTNVYRNGRTGGAGPAAESNLAVILLLLAHMPQLAVVIVHGKRAQRKITEQHMPAGVRYCPHWHFARRGMTKTDIEAGVKALVVEALGFVQDRCATVPRLRRGR